MHCLAKQNYQHEELIGGHSAIRDLAHALLFRVTKKITFFAVYVGRSNVLRIVKRCEDVSCTMVSGLLWYQA